MAKLPSAFKRKEHGSMRDFSAIPAGEYFIKATESSYVPTSNKKGHILKIAWTVQKGEHKGSKLFTNLNLDNPSEQAMEIANNEFGTICDACGKISVKDSSALHGILIKAKVAFIKGDNGNPDQNEIKMYSSAGSDEPDDIDDGAPDDDDDDGEEVNASDVKALAQKFKKMTSGKKLKAVLSEYDISKSSEIEDLEPDDLSSLKEDLEEEIEDAED